MYSELAPEKKGMRMRGGVITFCAIALIWQIFWPLVYNVFIPSIERHDTSFDFFEFAFSSPQYLFYLVVPFFLIIHAAFLHKFVPAKIVYTIVIALFMTGYVMNVVEYHMYLLPVELYWTSGIITMPLFLLSVIFVLLGKGGRGFVTASFVISFVITGIYFLVGIVDGAILYIPGFYSDEARFLYGLASLPVYEIALVIGLFILGLASCKVNLPIPAAPVYSAPVYNIPPYNPQPYNQPQYNQPQYNQPQYNQPQYNTQAYGTQNNSQNSGVHGSNGTLIDSNNQN